jgi:ribosomal protein S19E (S16A)
VIPEEIMNEYGITKTNLTDPENAAVATIAISADFLRQLRNLGVNHKSINEENIQNYLYYLYQGKRVQIKEALATPEDNLAIKKIMNVVLGLEFLEY